jgi:tRNA(Ser,Leu) C12 N-acetylase TAN1
MAVKETRSDGIKACNARVGEIETQTKLAVETAEREAKAVQETEALMAAVAAAAEATSAEATSAAAGGVSGDARQRVRPPW